MNRLLSLSATVVLFVLTVSILVAIPVVAQDKVVPRKYKIGDQVEVKYNGKWASGKVVEVLADSVVKAEFLNPATNLPRTSVFGFSGIRFVDIPGTQKKEYPTTPRTWTSSNGKFTIKATIDSIADGIIKLKRSDSNVIEVPVEKLSDEDQAFLNSLKKEVDPFSRIVDGPDNSIPQPTQAESGSPASQLEVVFELTEPNTDTAKPIAAAEAIAWNLDPIADSHVSEMPVPGVVSGVSRVLQIAHVRMVQGKSNALVSLIGGLGRASHLLLIDRKNGRQIANFKIPMGDVRIADISPNGKLAVTVSKKYDNNRVDIWEPTETELRHVIGWQVPNGGGSMSSVSEAVFVGNGTLATADRKMNLYVWNIEDAKLVFEKQVSPVAPRSLVATRDGKQLVFSGDLKFNVLNVESGVIQGEAKVPLALGDIAISKNGKMAVCAGRMVTVLDSSGLTSNQFVLPEPYGIGHCHWFDEQILLVCSHSRVFAIDTENRVMLARYEFKSGSCFLDENGVVWYLSRGRDQRKFGSVKIDPARFIDRLPARGDGLLLFRSGQTVRLDIDLPFQKNEIEKIKSHFADEVARFGANLVSGSAGITIRMTSQRHEPQEIKARDIVPGRVTKDYLTPKTNATVNAVTLKLEYIRDGRVVVERQVTSGPGHYITQKEGETLQQAVDRRSKSDPGFFSGARLPDNIAEHPAEGVYAIIKIGFDGVESEVFPAGG